MRNVALPLLLFCVMTMLSGCSEASKNKKVSKDELLAQISRIPMLYTVEAEVEVLVEGHGSDGTAEWKSLFGKRDIIVPVRANLKAGIKLSDIRDVEVDGDRVYITLPDPVIEIESTEIPWEEVVSSVSGFRSEFSGEEKEFLTRKGRMKILEDLSQLDLVVPAQEHAEQILGNLIAGLGLQPVFRARPVYLEKEIIRFVKE